MLWMGRITSWMLVIVGGVRVIMGLIIANDPDPVNRAVVAARYLGSGPIGEAIDQGFFYLALGIAFGLLTRIAQNTVPRENDGET